MQWPAVSLIQVKLTFGGFDGQSPTLGLGSVQSRPFSVMGDSNALSGDCTGTYGTVSAVYYDPNGKTLTLIQQVQNTVSWCIEF